MVKFKKKIALKDLLSKLDNVVRDIHESKEPYLVSENGKPWLVLLSPEIYEELVEEAVLFSSPKLRMRIAEARANYKAGEGGDLEWVYRSRLRKGK